MRISLLEQNILRLKLVPEIGNITLLNIFKDNPLVSQKILEFEDIKQFLTPVQVENYKCLSQEYFDTQIIKLLENLEKNNIQILNIFDKKYPVQLAKVFNPPILLFIKGNIEFEYDKSIAIVGTRRFSDYGKIQCQKFVKGLESKNFTIISGLASGIDSIALANGIKTKQKCIGVIGSGFDYVYPISNYRLYQEIVESDGAIISEYFPFERPFPAFFPARNRIIAGLSKSTLVIEAAKKSGSLITANFAFEQNRDVYALPADVDRVGNQGCNEIIRKGFAKLVTSPQDILEEYGFAENIGDKNRFDFVSDPNHQNLLNQLDKSPQSSIELAGNLGVRINDLNITLTELEIFGLIERGYDDKWRLK